eukprot:Seg900.11 transcript_id=Seg900.11/GoldUCD/mRNA.D3Y31 product="Solute carrier family 22 member 13" protein_id=Seg900.11/GoldUCD/D3Y31
MEKKPKQRLRLDELLPIIGEFGRFQIAFDIALCILQAPGIMLIFLPYFSQHNPPWKCVTNSSTCSLNGTFSLASESYKARCQMPRSEWEYTEAKDYSIVTQFDLSCDREPYNYLATSLIFISWAIGAVVLGWLTDRFGRKLATLGCSAAVILIGFASAFSPNLTVYIVLRFLIGFFITGNIVYPFVLMSEYVGPRRRSLAGTTIWFTASLSIILLGSIAPFVRTWKMLTIWSTAPFVLTFAFFKFIPESARWLHLKGRKDEVDELLRKIARVNKKEYPEVEVIEVTQDADEGLKHFFHLFTPKKIALRSIIQGYAWIVCGLVYYGVSFAADDLGGSMYRDFLLSTLVGFPATILYLFLSNRFGRKKTVIIPMLIAGISCILVAIIPKKGSKNMDWTALRLFLGTLGKLCITVSFDCIYTWSTELYPTIIRGAGMGYLQIAARIGSALAPWVAKSLQGVHIVLPFSLMGGSSFICAILLLYLPETNNQKTAETIEDQLDANDASAISTEELCKL